MTPRPEQSNSDTLRTKLGAAWAQLRYLPRVWSLVWAASRGWTIAWGALLALQGLLPVVTVYLTRHVVDAVVAVIGAGASWDTVMTIAWPVGLMGGTLLITEILRAMISWIRERQIEFMQDQINGLIHDTSTAVDLAFYESPDYYDHLHRARNEAWHRPQKLVENAGNLLQSGITLVAMGAVLFRFSAWIPLILLFSTVPALYVVLRHALKQHQWRLENTAEQRLAWYCDHEMTDGESAAELRQLSLSGYFKTRYRTIRRRLRAERLRLSRDQSLAELGAAVIALLATAGCLGWMGLRALDGLLTLGELALFYVAFRQGQQMMRSLLGNVGDIYRNILFLGNLFEFLDLKSTILDPEKPLPVPTEIKKGLEFRNVDFAYPGTETKVLDEFGLAIPAGKVVAIVGPNGSGKSTLVRLICRLYDPQSGEIVLDGVNLKEYRVDELRQLITVLFQKPVHYSVTVSKSIAFGDLEADVSLDDLEQAAHAAGAGSLISKLPHEYETLLGKWFDGGVELSVGEWQRIALARTLLRRARILLLDEPTSAMDSWTETGWMKRLRELAEARTAVIITHRFTTAMRADIIYVMDEGRIVESGSHEELLKLGGSYADSWQEQMRDK